MNVQQVIVLANHTVSIWPPNIPDGQLFIRRHAICLAPIRSKSQPSLPLDVDNPPKNAYYLFSENCAEKEDFYFAILRASKRGHSKSESNHNGRHSLPKYPDPLIDAHPLQFGADDIQRLINTINSTDAHQETMWLNALLGRMFLALNQTSVLENFVKTKIDTKLSRVKRPSFLGDITVTKVHCGTSSPYLTNINLKEFT